jgi:hypothetical protein
MMFRKILIFVSIAVSIVAQQVDKQIEPVEYVYKFADTTALKAYVFFPERENKNELRSAVLVFHGGGWSEGTPEWAFSRGRHFVQQGMVSAAIQYRLSDKKASHLSKLWKIRAMRFAGFVQKLMNLESIQLLLPLTAGLQAGI